MDGMLMWMLVQFFICKGGECISTQNLAAFPPIPGAVCKMELHEKQENPFAQEWEQKIVNVKCPWDK